MYSLETIRQLNAKATMKAVGVKRQPLVISKPDHIDRLGEGKLVIPNLGNYVPCGWLKTDQVWFCDSTGLGDDTEMALTMAGFKRALHRYLADHPKFGIGITECGQFQLYVTAFESIKS